jgi:hypothetical protein
MFTIMFKKMTQMKQFQFKSYFVLIGIVLLISCSKNDTTTTQNGVSGSLAKMIIVGDYLYVIDNQSLTTFDIQNTAQPISKKKIDVGFGIETIFPFANYLFIGSTNGMYIYSIANPENPVPASSSMVEHITACDPVVANSNYAYVTLNSIRTECGNFMAVNEMQIVDIQNIINPSVVNIIPMQGPKGLGLDGNYLFVCDKDLGVVVFDLTGSPSNPTAIDTLTGFTANDLIPDNGNLLVVCEDGLRQFDYTDITNISFISFLDTND